MYKCVYKFHNITHVKNLKKKKRFLGSNYFSLHSGLGYVNIMGILTFKTVENKGGH